jgi:DnaJ family protein B protein 6
MPEKNYYEILEIERTATAGQIKSAYLRLALKWHPDKNLNNRDEAERKFKEIGEAYSVFSDPIKKNEYDSFAATENFNYDFNDDFDTRDLFERELGK